MMKKLEKILMPLAEAIGRNKYLMSIRDGFLVSTPLLIGGSIFLRIHSQNRRKKLVENDCQKNNRKHQTDICQYGINNSFQQILCTLIA